MNSFARLTVNGTALQGDSNVVMMGGVDVSADHIELYSLRFGASVDVARSAGSTQARGRRTYSPLVFVKRIDRTTPLLYQALAQNARISGSVKMFNLDPVDGSVRHFFTVEITDGALLSIASAAPDSRDQSVSSWSPYEEVSVSFARIEFHDLMSSVSFEDSIARQV